MKCSRCFSSYLSSEDDSMIRFAQDTVQDTLRARKIWEECFGDPPQFTQWYFREVSQPENTLLYEVEGQLASHLQIRFFDLSLRGIPTKSGYLAGVATYPQFRKRGYSRALIEKAFSHLLDNGASFCFLVPTTFSFYDQFGFGVCCDKTVYTVAPNELPSPAKHLWQTAGLSDTEVLNRAYLYSLQSNNGYVLRSETDWNIFMQDNLCNSRAECRFIRAGRECGYYIARFDEKKKSLLVTEYGYTSADIYLQILQQIALLGAKCDLIRVIAPTEEGIHPSLGNFCDRRETTPYAMGRILSAECALSLCAKAFSSSVCIAVEDTFLPQNNGTFHIQNHSVSRGGTADLRMNIQTLSMLFWGYIDIQTACDKRLIQGNANKAEELFSKQKNYLDNSILAF